MQNFSLTKRLLGRCRHWATWRCAEPVVVFESDDWGLERQACASLLCDFGVPGEWADEETETPEDLAALYAVLAGHHDTFGRPACMTANFVVANPDWDAIAESHYTRYHDRPIDENHLLREHWLAGYHTRVFLPQYHARHHFRTTAWLRDLQEDVPGARALFAHRCPGGLALLAGQGWRYHTEYLDWHAATPDTTTASIPELSAALDIFQRTFGFASRSTIAPHYIFPDHAAHAWQLAGIHSIQGAGYRLLRTPGRDTPRVLSHVLGERSPEGQVYLTRPVKFDPRPQRPQHGAQAAIARIKHCFANHIPAIIDTHRINYTGRWRGEALASLREVLAALAPDNPLYLTSPELGEAIANQGRFHDAFSHECRTLTPLETVWRVGWRRWLTQQNRATIAQHTDT